MTKANVLFQIMSILYEFFNRLKLYSEKDF